MNKLKKYFLSIIISLSVLLFTPKEIFAQQSKTITYDINESGVVEVTYDIHLENENPNTYITKYTLSIGYDSARNVSAQLDDGTNLNYNVKSENGSTNIEVFFPDPRSPQPELDWTLTFASENILETIGKVNEIAIPGFIGDFDLNVVILAPKSFGGVNYYSKEPDEISELNNKQLFKYTSQEIRETGILISFGDTQAFDFTYKYELKNEEQNKNIRVTITLPPDYKNQEIFYDEISPEPIDGYKDVDGNYIAEYLLEPEESYEVLIQGKAILTNTLNNTFEAPDLELENYIKSHQYWDTTSTEIIELANQITEGKESDKEKAKAIYDYVVENLSYNEEALTDSSRERLGAINVLMSPNNAICQEYADLFVTLTRASGIPSRMLAGYTTAEIGYNLPENTLHAWAEFYTEEEGWITVDPTWESTSEGFDFFGNVGLSHFVLAIRGVDSVNPSLVLSFLDSDDVSDNLVIKPIVSTTEKENEVNVEFDFPSIIKTAVFSKGNVIIKNETNLVLTNLNINTNSNNVQIEIPQFDENRAIFPGEEESIEISFYPNQILTAFSENITFNITGTLGEKDSFEQNLTTEIKGEINNVIFFGLTGGILLITLIIVYVITTMGKKKSIEK